MIWDVTEGTPDQVKSYPEIYTTPYKKLNLISFQHSKSQRSLELKQFYTLITLRTLLAFQPARAKDSRRSDGYMPMSISLLLHSRTQGTLYTQNSTNSISATSIPSTARSLFLSMLREDQCGTSGTPVLPVLLRCLQGERQGVGVR